MGKPFNWFPFTFLFLVCSTSAPAQDFRGALLGAVTDAGGGRIKGADIVLMGASSGIERTTATNDLGEFRFDDLSPEPYVLTVRVRGFADAKSTVTVATASVREVAVIMNPASVPQSVNVRAGASSIT